MNAEVRLLGLSKSARYAVMGLVYLAGKAPQRVLAEDAARNLKLPRSYLAKLFQRLAQKGLLASQRGPNGGYALARPAESMSLAEVVSATQEQTEDRVRDCLLEPQRCAEHPCALHEHLIAAETRVKEAFGAISLAQAAKTNGFRKEG